MPATQNEALRGIVEVYLNARHPLRKAQRAEARQAKQERSNLDISSIKSHPDCLEAGKENRKIPAHLKHYIFHRDRGQCTYMSPSGKKCAADKFLEIDHITPWAQGGKHEASNLRLLCRGHNQLRNQRAL